MRIAIFLTIFLLAVAALAQDQFDRARQLFDSDMQSAATAMPAPKSRRNLGFPNIYVINDGSYDVQMSIPPSFDPLSVGNPGATGMNTRSDASQLAATDARYAKNIDVSDVPGMLKRRWGLTRAGDNSVITYGVTGFYDMARQYKNLFGVVDGPGTVLIDTVNTWSVPSGALRQMAISNLNAYDLGDSTLSASNAFLGYAPYSFTQYEGHKVVASRGAPPYLYVTNYSVYPGGSYSRHWPDTTFYEPHAQALGLEAPGQPRVGLVAGSTGGLSGIYRYSYRLNGTYLPAIPSRYVRPQGEHVFVTLFEPPKKPNWPSDTTLRIDVFRERYGNNSSLSWRQIGAVYMSMEDACVFIDSGQSGSADSYLGVDVTARANVSDSIRPGGLWRSGQYDTLHVVTDTGTYSVATTDVMSVGDRAYFAYSYYDPITGAESPLGPIMYDTLVADPSDTVLYAMTKTHTREFERPHWVRLYRTEATDEVDDPTLLTYYCIAQCRANNCNPDYGTKYLYEMFPGYAADSQLATSMMRFDEPAVTENFIYRGQDIPRDEDGGLLIRPPYEYGCDLSFSSITYANGRMWGVGEPIYPNRAYYSEYDNPRQWDPTSNWIDVASTDNDELVAVVSVGNAPQVPIYLFKHNAIYLLAGYDPEYDLSLQQLEYEVGVLSQRAVVTLDNAVYFMAPNMRIYQLVGTQVQHISGPIDDHIDTLFTGYEEASDSVRAFRIKNKCCWYSVASGQSICYDYDARAWSVESYESGVVPDGGFRYDTTSTLSGFGEGAWHIWQADSAEAFIVAQNDRVDTSAGAAHFFDAVYESPAIGDGKALWEIKYITLSARFDDTLSLFVVDRYGTTLTADTVTVAHDGRSFRSYRIGFGTNQSDYVALRIETGDANRQMDISEMNIYVQRQGYVATE